jgi:hypothetical protein
MEVYIIDKSTFAYAQVRLMTVKNWGFMQPLIHTNR